MTTIRGTTLTPHLFERSAPRRSSEFNRGLIFAAAAYLAVTLVEFSIIVLAAPGIAETGGLAVSVP